ncbi:hypothetical protein CO166_05170 [Candidatus Roizmanbacteria bacterium CG_4_9_14_3_um_filter_36_11]|nr:MAG: hypothetical protein CO166_05170 [Candidatus Roizmanbacteria bacterium CG_4_9_14_3_um_filter_36_11]
MKKTTPYIFLAVLFVTLTFILGVRYGQRVEQANKVINYLISLPPTKSPISPPPVAFSSYENKDCGIRFLIPSTVKIQYESTSSGKFNEKGVMTFQFDCTATIENYEKTATEEVRFQNKKILVENAGGMMRFQIINPRNGKLIYLYLNPRLFPLFEKSLEFISP